MLSTLFKISSILLLCTSVMANDIYINQSGDNADIDITQDGQNNRISSKNNTVNGTPNSATFVGKNQTLNSTQTGDDNFLGLYKHYYGSDGQTSGSITTTQIGDDNIMRMDSHGDNNNFTAYQNTNNSTMDLEIDQDGNTVDARQRCSVKPNCNSDSMVLKAALRDLLMRSSQIGNPAPLDSKCAPERST